MTLYCIVLWNRVFERHEIYFQVGSVLITDTFENAVRIANSEVGGRNSYKEVPINSRIGRQILAKIGERKV